MERGSTESEALSLAPEASWISLIRAPPFPMIDPIRIEGMSSLRGYVFDCGFEASAKGSLLRVRMIRPKAFLD